MSAIRKLGSASGLRILRAWRTNQCGYIHAKCFHVSAKRSTDGVHQDLTNMRVRVPWIEAFNQRRQSPETHKEHDSRSGAKVATRKLEPKKMSDSFHRLVIPLAQNHWLGDNYLNATGHIRIGTLFMDLDALAGVVAYKFTGDDVTTVTAAVDRITIKHPLQSLCDIELSGQVTYATGRSSMEVSLQVAKAPAAGQAVSDQDVMMTCAFTMVSLDPVTKLPAAVNPLLIETAEERRLFKLGEKNMNEKKILAKKALKKQPPNEEESSLIHTMWLKQLDYHDPNTTVRRPDNVRYMSSTILHSSQIMQPQYRNRHNFMIFGGYLLKQTFELAFCCAASFSHSRPSFLSLDPSTFENPVPVGSVLYLTATVALTTPASDASGFTRVQVRVDSKVRNIEHQEVKSTGQFNYTFLVEKEVGVMPQSYSEFMIWIDAKRRAERIQETNGSVIVASLT